jgi:hypothetical protein
LLEFKIKITPELLGEQHVSKTKQFVEEYSTKLQEIEEALEETLSQAFDFNTNPISLQLQPYEQANLLQLIKTDNKIFNKLMIVFSSLCLEMQYLKDMVRFSSRNHEYLIQIEMNELITIREVRNFMHR